MDKIAAPVSARFSLPLLPKSVLSRERINKLLSDVRDAKIVYVSAAAGWGKTTAVADYLSSYDNFSVWCNVQSSDGSWLRLLKQLAYIVLEADKSPKAITAAEAVIGQQSGSFSAAFSSYLAGSLSNDGVKNIVIDSAQNIASDEAKVMLASFIKNSPDGWHFFVLSRDDVGSTFGEYLKGKEVEYIGISELRFTREEQYELFKADDIYLSKGELFRIMTGTDGWIIALNAIKTAMSISNETDDETLEKLYGSNKENQLLGFDISNAGYVKHYVENRILPLIDERMAELMKMLSVLDKADAELAEYISGFPDAAELLERAQSFGGFVSKPDSDTYAVIGIFGDYVKNGAVKNNEIFCKAAQYYENKSDLINSLYYYGKASMTDEVARVLEKIADDHSLTVFTQKAWDYLFALDERMVASSPSLCAAMCAQLAVRYRPDESYYWYQKLLQLRKTIPDDKKDFLEQKILYAKICVPQTNDNELFKILKNVFADSRSLAQIEITGCMPSVLRGTKDFSNWVTHLETMKFVMTPIFSKIFGKYSFGLAHICTGEAFYEQNKLDKALNNLSEGISQCISSGTVEVQFVGYSQLARYFTARGNYASAVDSLKKVERHLECANYIRLMQNYRAETVLFMLIKGRLDEALQWLNAEAPAGITEFTTEERYTLIVKAKVLLAARHFDEAIGTFIFLRRYNKLYNRKLDYFEVTIYLAMCYFKIDDIEKMCELLAEAVEGCRFFGYIRVFADGGSSVSNMLIRYREEKKIPQSDRFLAALIGEAKIFGDMYPDLFADREDEIPVEALTEAEKKVLSLWTEGYSQTQISKELFISVGTVKWHLGNIRDKLGVRERAEIIKVTKKYRLLG